MKQGVIRSAPWLAWHCLPWIITVLFAPNDPSAGGTPNNPKYRVFGKMHLISDMYSLRGIDSLNSSLLALTIRV